MSDSSFVKKAAIAGTLIAAGALGALWIASSLPTKDIDEDDRPPIIVNNGSIEFRAVPILGSAGSWVSASGTWRHDHGKDGPDHFKVHVGGSSSITCAPKTYNNIDRIAVTHTGAAGTNPINVKVVKDDAANKKKWFLTVEAGNLDKVSAAGEVLTVDHGTGIMVKNVTLYKNNAVVVSCDYSAAPSVLIEQKR